MEQAEESGKITQGDRGYYPFSMNVVSMEWLADKTLFTLEFKFLLETKKIKLPNDLKFYGWT